MFHSGHVQYFGVTHGVVIVAPAGQGGAAPADSIAVRESGPPVFDLGVVKVTASGTDLSAAVNTLDHAAIEDRASKSATRINSC